MTEPNLWLLVASGAAVAGAIAWGIVHVATARSRWSELGALANQRTSSASSAPSATEAARPLDHLPAPVQRYLRQAGVVRRDGVIIQHRGRFRPKLGAGWLPIQGLEGIGASPPRFVWFGDIRVVPALWISGRDRSIDGVGEMWITLWSRFTLARRRGPEIDQGALIRLLGELVWLPSALADTRFVTWRALDEGSAEATLRVGATTAVARFEFGPDGWPRAVHAERTFDDGHTTKVLPWSGEMADFRPVRSPAAVHGVFAPVDAGRAVPTMPAEPMSEMWIPHRMTAIWHIDGVRQPYAEFIVTMAM